MPKLCYSTLFTPPLRIQAGSIPARVRRIYVGELGNKPEAAEMRKALVGQLRKSKDFEVVDSSSQADAVLDGDTEIYIKGYFSLYARAGSSPANGQPIYGGYVSAELKSPSGDTLWSYLSTLHSSSKNPAGDLSKDIYKHLVADVASRGEKK